MRLIKIDQEYYNKIKNCVLNQEKFEYVPVNSDDITINSLSSITIKNHSLPLSDKGFDSLMSLLGVNKAIINKFTDNKTKGSDKEFEQKDKDLINLLIKALKSNKRKSILLIFNKEKQSIVNMILANSKHLQDEQYFEILERTLARNSKAYIRNLVLNYDGTINCSIITGDEFNFGNKADEVFLAGLNIDFQLNKLTSSFYTERLVCSNGNRIVNKLVSKNVNTSEDLPDFLQFILSEAYKVESIELFKKRITTNYFTQASLREVVRVDKILRSLLGDFSGPLLKRTRIPGIIESFNEEFITDTENHAFFRTDLSLWGLVNDITSLSSLIEQNNLIVPDNVNLGLQTIGGDALFHKPDLLPANIKQVYPNFSVEDFKIKNGFYN